MPEGPMTGRAEFTLGGPLDNLADRLALGLITLGVRPEPGERLRTDRRDDDLPMLTDSMSHIPAWAREAAGGAVGWLPFGIVTIVQRERSRSWSVELLHLDGGRDGDRAKTSAASTRWPVARPWRPLRSRTCCGCAIWFR